MKRIMNKKTKSSYILIFTLLLFAIIIIIAIVYNMATKGIKANLEDIAVSEKEKKEAIKEEQRKMEEELMYYDTIEEAVKNCTYDEYTGYEIKEIIKLLQGEQYAVLFFIADKDGDDILLQYKLKLKKEASKILYSTPIHTTGTLFLNHKRMLRQYNKINQETANTEKVKADINLNFPDFNLDEEHELHWGILMDEITQSLKINGLVPTEVLPITMDNETAYFWYYEDLPTNNKTEINVEFTD